MFCKSIYNFISYEKECDRYIPINNEKIGEFLSHLIMMSLNFISRELRTLINIDL